MTDVDVVRAFYDALNRADTDAAMALLDPSIVRVEFEGSPSAGTYRGLDELRAHLVKGRSTWAEGACTPERVDALGDRLLVHVHVRVRLKGKDDWLDGHVADLFAVRGGKIVEFRSYFDADDATRFAQGAASSIN